MLIGILSDIHGNHRAMSHALDNLTGIVDEVLVVGDAFSDHQFSNAVVGEIRGCGARYVLGNHELSLLSPAGIRARSSAKVSQTALAFVAEQPTQIRTTMQSKRLLMVHGSPWEPYGEYLSPNSHLYARSDELDAEFVITGHTHHAFSRRFGHTLVVNPGSLGRSDDPDRPDRVTYAILDTDTEVAEIVEIPNPLYALD